MCDAQLTAKDQRDPVTEKNTLTLQALILKPLTLYVSIGNALSFSNKKFNA
jgi:hypothetical protein